MQPDLLRVPAKGGAISRAVQRELFLVASSINTCYAPLRFLCGFPRPKLGPEQSTLICFKLTRLDSTWKTECFVNIFPKTCQWSVQPIVAATAPRLTCRFVCHVCLPIFFFLSSSFHYFSFSFRFLFYLCFHFIWRRHRWNSNWIVAMPRCLLCLSLSLSLCLLGISLESHLGYLRELWPSSHRLADDARLKELANLLSGGKLSLYFLSIGRATNCLWHNHKQKLIQK